MKHASLIAAVTLVLFSFPAAAIASDCVLGASVSGGALTAQLLVPGGDIPSSGEPCDEHFRSASLGSGDVDIVHITAQTRVVTAASGDTFGMANATPGRLWVTAWNTDGVVALGLSNQVSASDIFQLDDDILQSSAALGGTAKTAGQFYTTAPIVTRPISIVGYVDFGIGQTVAGVWSNQPTRVQTAHDGMRRPGDSLKTRHMSTQSGDVTNTTANYMNTSVTLDITLDSPVDLVHIEYDCTISANNAVVRGMTAILRGGAIIGVPTFNYSTAGGVFSNAHGEAWDAPGSSSKQTYTIGITSGIVGFSVHACTGVGGGSIQLEEVSP